MRRRQSGGGGARPCGSGPFRGLRAGLPESSAGRRAVSHAVSRETRRGATRTGLSVRGRWRGGCRRSLLYPAPNGVGREAVQRVTRDYLVARPCGFGVEACGPRGAVDDAASEVFRRQGEHLSVLVEGAAPGDHLAELRGRARRWVTRRDRRAPCRSARSCGLPCWGG